MQMPEFSRQFQALTGNASFPWQERLYCEHLLRGELPTTCCIPTGLGKTSVIACWLLALAQGAAVPRRLVYVVNRRTVVDQTTAEVEHYRHKLASEPALEPWRSRFGVLALSTLRGQFADNREWSADPSRPAVICGTVDMIGSRLLFHGYGVGRNARPLHAGFLGQDTLLVHDEAHLEPAFQKLLEAIRDEQQRCGDPWPLRVLELTATSRGGGEPFGLTGEDHKNTVVKERVVATKRLHLEPVKDAKKLAEQLAAKAKEFAERNRAVLVFVRTVDDVLKVAGSLPKDRVVTLTGTMRGKERDGLVEQPIFKRFLPGGQSDDPTTYLVCTAAGEVGVNISADHLVCDLTTFDSMAQRFGRVNRFGKRADSEIHVVHPSTFEEKDYEHRRAKTLALLRLLEGDASPAALDRHDAAARKEAFAPEPLILPATDMLFDAWALTTIREKLPGRPPVEPYLHGIAEWQPPETMVAWREEVERLNAKPWTEWHASEFARFAADLLEDFPLKPHELLKEPSHRAFKQFEAMAKRCPDEPVWLVDDDGKVEVLSIADLADRNRKDRIEGKTVLLPPAAGGLEGGMLNGAAGTATEVADTTDRLRVWDEDDERVRGMRLIRRVQFASQDEDEAGRTWFWFERPLEGGSTAKDPVALDVHVNDVVNACDCILNRLTLLDDLKAAIRFAARFHDLGKDRKAFQRVLGNSAYPQVKLAKSGRKRGSRMDETYRHEFGSLLDVMTQPEFKDLNADQQDLVMHLIAAHHGRARPHFPADEAFDPERPHEEIDRVAAEVPRRFGRLQRKYGRWGLAYLESLLRAADWAASGKPSAFVEGDG